MERYLNLEGCVTKEDDYIKSSLQRAILDEQQLIAFLSYYLAHALNYNQIQQLVHIRYLNLDFHEYELSITPECLQTMNNYLPDLPHEARKSELVSLG